MAAKALQDRVLHGVSANSPLPPSVETAYYRKCIELKRRINEIEENNDTLRVKKARIERAVLKMRIERAMLLESIGNKMKENPDDSDDSNSPPPTPQDRPLRSKRAHRKGTPTPGNPTGEIPQSSPMPQPPGSALPAETPDPLRVREYMPTAPSAEATPAPVNGTPAPASGVQLPPLSSALPPQSAPSGFAAINNPAPEENGDTEMGER